MRPVAEYGSVVVAGPSADGVPGPTTMRTAASAGIGAAGRTAIHRPSAACSLMLRALSSAATSAAVASRSGTSSPPAVTWMVGSTAAGSMRWSNTSTHSWSSARLSWTGLSVCTPGGGVVNVNDTSSASTPPVAEVVPSGTVTV